MSRKQATKQGSGSLAKHKFVVQKRVFVVVAPGFEDIPTIYCLSKLREAGLAVALVSNVAGLVSSEHGVAIRADMLLSDLILNPPPRLVIIPGGEISAKALVTDPRFHKLLEVTLASTGIVAILGSAQTSMKNVISATWLKPHVNYFQQNQLDVSDFIDQLINATMD